MYFHVIEWPSTTTRGLAMSTMELKAGPELDAAVAKAIGVPANNRHELDDSDPSSYKQRCRVCGEWIYTSEAHYEVSCAPPYSTDLNAAFEAAEKCGLFLNASLSRKENGFWLILGTPRDPRKLCVYGDSTPLAICAAILKLKGNG